MLSIVSVVSGEVPAMFEKYGKLNSKLSLQGQGPTGKGGYRLSMRGRRRARRRGHPRPSTSKGVAPQNWDQAQEGDRLDVQRTS